MHFLPTINPAIWKSPLITNKSVSLGNSNFYELISFGQVCFNPIKMHSDCSINHNIWGKMINFQFSSLPNQYANPTQSRILYTQIMRINMVPILIVFVSCPLISHVLSQQTGLHLNVFGSLISDKM